MLVIISSSVVSPSVIVLLIASITERNHLSRRFRIPGEDVIVSWICGAFAAHVIRRRFVNGGECRRIIRHHIFCVSTFLPCVLSQEYMLLFVAAAIPNHQAPQTTYRTHAHLYNSSTESSFAK
jgi:hypothetical protein